MNNNMNITYIYHSGFSVELENATLLFDYYKGQLPKFDPNKQIYVFSSHSHPDHFNKDIFDLANTYPKVTYILSSDIEDLVNSKSIVDSISSKQIYYIKANEEKLFLNGKLISSITGDHIGQDKSLKVKTLDSTDQGVAFLVSVDDKVIFHAGDLHWWTWSGETKQEYQDMTDRFFEEVAKISKVPIDVAFLPLDPRQEDRFYWGFDYYMQTCNINTAVPMHFWEDFSLITKFKNMEESEDYASKIINLEHVGQSFIIA